MSWGYFTPSRPREAKGGIQAVSRRGAFGATWWGRRWMQTLESFGMESRLTRGRSYARGGQVLSIDIGSGSIQAAVQGSRPKPYTIKITLATLDDAGWKRVQEALQSEPLLTARLLAGEMPEEIEAVFKKAGSPLFPERIKDLSANCSCPDSANPCKHLAAVYCLLAEEFDRDPFHLFVLRGRDRETLLQSLGGDTSPDIEPTAPPEPLPTDPAAFWEGIHSALPPIFGPLRRPSVNAPILRQLGPFPLWRVAIPVSEALEEEYAGASVRALERIEAGANLSP